MKITHHWLREFTPVECSAEKLAAQLTLAGLEVESVAAVSPPFSGVVVGEVLATARHPAADKLSVCQVTTDGNDRLQIICGASNVRAGLKVAVAMVTAQLPNGVTIKRAKLRGMESNGMLCSARELGLGDDHEGIMELDEAMPLGEDLRVALALDDSILEVNATPNRGDCMSVFGIARDYAAARGRPYLQYVAPAVAPVQARVFPASIAAGSACPLFASRVVLGVSSAASSPAWLKERLRRVGLNSISPIVDVTNYVMVELGQPLHAYDLAKLDQGIHVRWAKPQEKITLLDDKDYVLGEEHLVIADGRGAIGLAGIMGGKATAISPDTTDILLEAAHFVPAAVAGRARRLGLLTDAAQRFERGVDPSLPAAALERATALLIQCAGGMPGPVQLSSAAGAGGDAPDAGVDLRAQRLERLLGTRIEADEVYRVLQSISGNVAVTATGWRVRSPPHRFDIRIEVDLIEEVARLLGFERIAESHAMAPQVAGPSTESRVTHERLATGMVDRGYREAITYAFVDPAVQRQLFPNASVLSLANPISAELSEMRVSLWTGLLQACRENSRRQQLRVRLFELGKKFELQRGEVREIQTLAGLATGARWPEQWGAAREATDFFDVKADLLQLLTLTGDSGSVCFEADTLECLRPGRTARISRDGAKLGWLGELHPQLQKSFHLPNPVVLFELEVDLAFSCNILKFKGISKFPSVRRDLAVVVDESVPVAVVSENVSVVVASLLAELRIFDIYRGPGVDSGRKSVALGLILQDSSRTLTDQDADAVVTAVVVRLRDVLSATIRDQ